MEITAPLVAGSDRGDADLSALLRMGVVAQAAAIARDGNLAAAADVLTDQVNLPQPSLAALNLLARIRAQQGAYLDAERLWQRVLQSDPTHSSAMAALLRLRNERRRRVRNWPLALVLAALLPTGAAVYLVTLRSGQEAAMLMDLRAHLEQTAGDLQELRSNGNLGNEGTRSILQQWQSQSVTAAERQRDMLADELHALSQNNESIKAQLQSLANTMAANAAQVRTLTDDNASLRSELRSTLDASATLVARQGRITTASLRTLTRAQERLLTRLNDLENASATH